MQLDYASKNKKAFLESGGLTVEEGVLQCGRCKSRNTEYTQKQTRSADEPMTTCVRGRMRAGGAEVGPLYRRAHACVAWAPLARVNLPPLCGPHIHHSFGHCLDCDKRWRFG